MSSETHQTITAEQVAEFERSLKPGKVPKHIWREHRRLEAGVAAEMALFRVHDGKIQVYMTQREADDPDYPGQLHMPGKMCDGNDKTIESAYQRLADSEELHGLVLGERKFINPTTYKETPRGNEAAFLLLVEVLDGGDEKNWYNAEDLPPNTIEHHVYMISLVLDAVRSELAKENCI